MKIKSLIAASLIALSSVPYVAQAQQGTRGGINALPPALRAAVISGNGNSVAQAIRALAGNNGQQSANLAALVVAAAEGLLAINPQAAIAAATAAVETVQNTQVQTSAPSQTQSVIATAARIFVSPNALNVAPNQAAALATATLQVAQATGNPTPGSGRGISGRLGCRESIDDESGHRCRTCFCRGADDSVLRIRRSKCAHAKPGDGDDRCAHHCESFRPAGQPSGRGRDCHSGLPDRNQSNCLSGQPHGRSPGDEQLL
jgi:hypothetical protein